MAYDVCSALVGRPHTRQFLPVGTQLPSEKSAWQAGRVRALVRALSVPSDVLLWFLGAASKVGLPRPSELRVPATIGSVTQTGDIRSVLVRMSPAELAETYAAGQTGPIPHGRARGVAMLFPTTGLTPILARIAPLIWQGKIFDAKAKTLRNQVLGFRLIPAMLYPGPSWFDTGDAVIIDYEHTSLSFSRVRDEIRQIAPGYWLGRSYYRRAEKGSYMLSFGLDFRT
jgi:hypothetical protein